MKKTLLLVSILSFIVSCTPDLVLNNDLKEKTEVMQVKGKQGFRIKQVISYGEFETSKVKRSWTTSYNIPLIVTFKGAKQKLSYLQVDGKRNVAEVFGASVYSEKEIGWLSEYFKIQLDYKSYYTGTIALDKGTNNWDYIIFNPNTAHWNNVTRGFARNGSEEIEIKGVKKLKGQASFMNLDVYGYEFIKNGRSIGAVSIVNNGRVWMRTDLDDETRLVLASLSSGLMLRDNIEEEQ